MKKNTPKRERSYMRKLKKNEKAKAKFKFKKNPLSTVLPIILWIKPELLFYTLGGAMNFDRI